jgi:hypothetical protein
MYAKNAFSELFIYMEEVRKIVREVILENEGVSSNDGLQAYIKKLEKKVRHLDKMYDKIELMFYNAQEFVAAVSEIMESRGAGWDKLKLIQGLLDTYDYERVRRN